MSKLVVVRGSTPDRVVRLGALALLLAFAFYVPQYFNQYRTFQFTRVLIYAVVALGLNLLTGYNGQISLGHSFFFGAGAYAVAILVSDYGWHYLLAIPVAAAFTFVLGYLFGIPALRLHGLYLALVTLALGVVFPQIVKSQRFNELTGGSQGINIPPVQAPGWTGLANDQWVYYVCLVVTILMFVVAWNLTRGRIGRAIVSIRENHIAAETMGIDTAAVKTRVFAYSAMYAGIAGGLFTVAIAFVAPESFTVTEAVTYLAAVVVGGLATISGAVFGALFVVFVPVWASEINRALSGVIYGAALILFMFVMPGGVVGLLRKLRARLVRIEGPRRPAAASEEPPDATPQGAPVGALRDGAWQSTDERGSA